ncbi:MAG: hypothetical protein LBQ22_02965 [Bacteroidales bacterium]|jgi:hypothetical protein|nr:hypothetical protein [Bacteroidales bacterium]
MKNKIIKNIDQQIINQLIDDDSSILDSYLENEGYNIDEIETIALRSYKKLSFILNGTINQQKDQALLEKISLLFKDAINKNLDKPVHYLKNLITNNELQVQYRNLDKLSIEEIQNIIKDQNLIELLEKFDNDKE